MKIAFSTLGCPDFSWTDIYAMAKDLGYDGIEIRGLGNDIFAVSAQPFRPEQRAKTVAKLRELKLEIPCLSSGSSLRYPWKKEETLLEIRQYIALAKEIGTPFIRLLADVDGPVHGEVDDEFVLEMLQILAPEAEEAGVTLLCETNGVYADTKRLRALLDRANSPAVAALWDFHHPFRYFGESAQETIANLGGYIRYCHAKDSVMPDGKLLYRMMGEGDLPLDDMLGGLADMGYDGYITLEWVKRWTPDLLDAGIVFPHYANYMKMWAEERLEKQHPVLPVAENGGEYIWPKETLIDETLPQALDRVAELFPEHLAFAYTTEDYTRTYREFRDDVDAFARSLIAMGVKKGDHVAIWATNVSQWFLTFWASVRIGAVLVSVNTAYKVHETEYLLRQSDTHTLVMIGGYKDADYLGIINEICPELGSCRPGELHSKRLPVLRNIITCGCENPGCYTWEQALSLGDLISQEEVLRRSNAIRQDDVCNMQYTSGTTGFPKGVMLTHRSVLNNGKAIGDCMDLSSFDHMMIQVPMFHCFGMVLAMTASVTHATAMSPIPYFSPRVAFACLNTHPITAFHGVPTMFIAMLGHPDFPNIDFSHMRTGIMAGSPCPVKAMQDVIDKMHMRDICITYGLTEASPACTMSKTTDPIDFRVNTVGQPIFGVECKVVDPATGEEVPDNTDGEFVARGYNVMRGYYKMPEATAAAIDRDGWLHSGDLARRLPNGYFKITGRIKDMIIRGGENIYPKEIEEFLYTHEKVKDVQVIGVPDAQYGEEIMAWIVPKEGCELTAEEMREFCLSHMAKHKCPKYFHFVSEFPMNAAAKVLKYKMREQAIEILKLEAANRIVTA